MNSDYRIGSLCSGYGGLDLGVIAALGNGVVPQQAALALSLLHQVTP